jgi:hypothetical protein
VLADSAHTEITVLTSGDFAVRQSIQSRSPLFGLSLAPPSSPFLGDGMRATDLQVVADGTLVDGPSSLDSSPAAFSFPGTHTVDLTYRLSGVLVRSSSNPDRALARMISLDISFEPRPGPTFSFDGATVLNLFCVDDVGDEPPLPCGQRSKDGWQVQGANPQANYRVMALMDLPPSSSS